MGYFIPVDRAENSARFAGLKFHPGLKTSM
jgi:hypothetical protein